MMMMMMMLMNVHLNTYINSILYKNKTNKL